MYIILNKTNYNLKELKKNIKNFLFKYKLTFIINIYTFFFFNLANVKVIKKLIIKYKSQKIIKVISKKKNKKIIFFYDCKVSPSTIGDYFYFLILVKIFILQGFNVKICLIIGEYRNSWYIKNNSVEKESKNLIKYKIDYLINFSNQILNKKANIELKEFKNLDFHQLKKKYYIYNMKSVQKRNPIYRESFLTCNYILSKLGKTFVKKTFVKKNINFKINKTFKKNKFVTILCRYNPNKPKGRNLNVNEFKNVIKSISDKFKGYKIFVISDKVGCDYFKKISKQNNFKISFSKDYSNSILEDIQIVLNSKFCLSLKGGGGMTNILIFSEIPYLIHSIYWDEFEWNKDKLTFWQKNSQTLIVSKKNNMFFKSLKRLDINNIN